MIFLSDYSDGYTTHHLKIDFLHRNFDDLRIAVYKTPLVNISNDNLYILYKSVIDSLGCFGGSTHLNRKTDKNTMSDE